MDLKSKLAILADAAKYDASCASSGVRRRNTGGLGNSDGVGICHSYTPDGRCVSLLKILLTNYCVYDCQYCVNRVSSSTPRARFTPEEVVELTLNFYRRNYIEGLFLSSGIAQTPDDTMEQLTRVAALLRDTHHFHGYIHLKAVPGASADLLARAGRYADRLSANIELPTQPDLQKLAPEKSLTVITGAMATIKNQIDAHAPHAKTGGRSLPFNPIQNPEATLPLPQAAPIPRPRTTRYAPAGQSTQIIVGATPSSDALILAQASSLYHTFRLRRVYYSAFSPIPHADSRLPGSPPPLIREHRLYQADWLIRFYGFSASEIADQLPAGNLPLHQDPKTTWALLHRDQFPVDLNKAPRHRLLRVPGLGVRNVDRLLRLRRHKNIRTEDLLRLHVPLKRAKPFVTTADFNPDSLLLDSTDLPNRIAHRQLNFFESNAGEF